MTKTALTIVMVRKKKRLSALKKGTGPTSGNHPAAKRDDIPSITANQVNIVGPSNDLCFLSCQYEIVAAMPSLELLNGTYPSSSLALRYEK